MKIEIESLANGGDGVGRLDDGRVVFVPRALPQDVVEIELVRSKKSWAKGRIVEVVQASPHRTAPWCQHFHECGGCAFQHLRYSVEFEQKSRAALETFRRISKLEPADGERVPAESVDGYRIRARFHCDGDVLGYHGRHSHDVFALRHCPVLDSSLDAVVEPLAAAVRGGVGEIGVETAGGGEITVELRGEFDLAHAEAVYQLDAVRGVRHPGGELGSPGVDASVALGCEVDAHLDAGRFRQSNGPMTSVLRDLVARRLGTGASLVELYAGSGSFTHHVAPAFERARAFEFDEVAAQLGNRIAADLGHDHVEFITANLDDYIPGIADEDTVLLDPPRTGAEKACGAIAEAGPSRVVYVSCDVATLARDAKSLHAGALELTSFDLVDMFPRTPHIEAIATWQRR